VYQEEKNMKKINRKKIFLFITILYFLIYIFLGFFLTNYSQSDLDYKTFTHSDACKYSINQINFYDFEEAGKSYQIYKYNTNFIRDVESLRCINKVHIIEDGWPVIRVEVSGDSLFFQLVKNSGLLIIFVFFVNFYPNNKKLFLLLTTLFNFVSYILFNVDFISGEFAYLYSYEIFFTEISILYLIYLKHSDFHYFKKILSSLQNFIFSISNRNIIIISCVVGFRSVYIFYTNTYANNIADWITNYNFGFVRRGLAGTILLGISNNLHFVAYTLLPIILFFLHFAVVYNCLKIYQENTKNIYSLFILFSPLYFLYPFFNVSKGIGNKELLGILCFLLIIRSSYKANNSKYFFLIITLYTLSIFSHEINLFILPILLIISYFQIITTDVKLLIVVSIISFIFICIYFLFPVSSETIVSLCNNIYLAIENLDCSKAYYLEQNGMNTINASINRVFEDTDYILVFGIYIILGLLPFISSGWFQTNYKLFFVVLIIFLPLFIVAIDWGRWLNILIYCFGAVYMKSESKKITKDLNLYNVIPLILYSTLWRVPQCCVEELNLVFLFRFNKYNFLIYIFLIYIVAIERKEGDRKVDEFIKL
jgi:hypothetical protein